MLKIRWLKELEQLNTQFSSSASAFVAQLHICVLIAAVLQYQTQIRPPKPKKEKNLVICQPIQFTPAHIVPSDFAFIPSVLEEAALDFSKMSEDFKYISSDFTISFLMSEIDLAIGLGISCRMFYLVRPLLSLQLRLVSAGFWFHSQSCRYPSRRPQHRENHM
jgi:hypothetical protein